MTFRFPGLLGSIQGSGLRGEVRGWETPRPENQRRASGAGVAARECEACGGGVRSEGGRKGCQENRSGRSYQAPSSPPAQASTWPSPVVIRRMFFHPFPWPKPEFCSVSSPTSGVGGGGQGFFGIMPRELTLLPSRRCCVGQTLLLAHWDPFKPLPASSLWASPVNWRS